MKGRKIATFLLMLGLLGVLGCNKITKEKYNQIKEGMSYDEVMNILGSDACTESASNSMEGVPGVMASIKTKAYSCENPGGSNAQLMFQNDRLVSKAQAGL